jgi:RinA family phage transcriptional activator
VGAVKHYSELSQSGFRYIEKLLYDYKKYDILIAEFEAELKTVIERLDEIYPPIPVLNGMPHSTNIGTPTEDMAIKKADNHQVKYLQGRIAEMRRHKEAITQVMQYLTDVEKLFIKLKYEQEKAPRQCMKEMHIEKSRWYELRHEIIRKIASYLGVY